MRYIATISLLINRLYIPFISPSSGSQSRIVQPLQLPDWNSIPPGLCFEFVYDKKGRGGVFLMILLESSAFCKAVEESQFEREFPEPTRGQIIDNVFYQ